MCFADCELPGMLQTLNCIAETVFEDVYSRNHKG